MKKYIAYLADLQCVAKTGRIDNVINDRLGFVSFHHLETWSSANKMKPKITWGRKKQTGTLIHHWWYNLTHPSTLPPQSKLARLFQRPLKCTSPLNYWTKVQIHSKKITLNNKFYAAILLMKAKKEKLKTTWILKWEWLNSKLSTLNIMEPLKSHELCNSVYDTVWIFNMIQNCTCCFIVMV